MIEDLDKILAFVLSNMYNVINLTKIRKIC